MGEKTGIGWTHIFGEGSGATWNPLIAIHKETGARGYACVRYGPGCTHCYAAVLNKKRIYGRLGTGLDYTLLNLKSVELTLSHSGQTDIEWPLRTKKPRGIFPCSMTDWIGEFVEWNHKKAIQETMLAADWHVFMPLTKRVELLGNHLNKVEFEIGPCDKSHIFYGVTICNQKEADRALVFLRSIRDQWPKIKLWVSYEPILGPVDWTGYASIINWLVAGYESGTGFRAGDPNWVSISRDWCIRNGVPFFFKQWAGIRPGSNGNLIDGQQWHQFPNIQKKEQEKP